MSQANKNLGNAKNIGEPHLKSKKLGQNKGWTMLNYDNYVELKINTSFTHLALLLLFFCLFLSTFFLFPESLAAVKLSNSCWGSCVVSFNKFKASMYEKLFWRTFPHRTSALPSMKQSLKGKLGQKVMTPNRLLRYCIWHVEENLFGECIWPCFVSVFFI